MRKIVSIITAILVCAALVCPALAASDFVPSISYKGTPEVVAVKTPNGTDAVAVIRDASGAISEYMPEDCLKLTPVATAADDVEIPAESKTLLLSVYAALKDGSVKLPYSSDVKAEDMVIRDLFDISFLCGHGHVADLTPQGVTFEMTFDLGLAKDAVVSVMTYKNNAWGEIAKVVNNGDGTITCTFESLCPVAVSVLGETSESPKDTGDAVGRNLHMWIALMTVSAVAVVALVVVRRKVQ